LTTTERKMNFNIDSKALVKTAFVNPNDTNASARLQGQSLPGRVGFAQTLAQLQSKPGVNSSTFLNPSVPSVAVQDGDTLSSIVKNHMEAMGRPVSNSEALRLSQDLAKANGISNPDRIYPGQRLNMTALNQVFKQAITNPPAASNPTAASNPPAANAALAMNSAAQARQMNNNHPVLEKTLDRAVAKGFIPPQERQQVFDKILNMSRTYQFAPDDFARMTLMESDGMNPKASNNRCHGIIQFCDGPDRGAASAGFGSNAKAILGHSVLQQLDMVSKYFDETGLKGMGPTSLDDLYLTVLTPSARSVKAPDAHLNIAGSQAKQLYVNNDKGAPITRNSIMQGLYQNAIQRLSKHEHAQTLAQANTAQASNNPQLNRAQALRVSAYLNQDYLR
jgi:LysM repeat protein